MSSKDLLARPLSDVIRQVAVSVADGQADLDRTAIAVQRSMDEAKARGELDYDLDASWFQFAGVDVDVSVALSLDGVEERDRDGTVRGYRPVLSATPFSPRLQNTYAYDIEAASDVSLSIVPVPPKDRV